MTTAEGKDGLPSPFGRYTLVERLATGGMAEVFKAKISSSHGFEKLLVIKRILPNLAADKNFVSMFIDEAKLTAQLIHPKIVQVIDFGDVAGQLFIALEFIDGFDALALLRVASQKQLRLPIPISVFITMELLDALDYAHHAKDVEGKPMRLVHRDISPSNVFIARRGDVKLGDFGIAHAQKRESKTQVGTLKGKYGYMSPEQVVGASLDARSDLFAVGVVLAEMLAGRRLFTAPNDLDVLLMVRDGNLDRWDKHGRDTPAPLDKIVRKALARRVSDRFQSAAEFREALSDLLFASGFRIGPSDLGRVAADYFDDDPAAMARLREQVQKWEMRQDGGAPVRMTGEHGAVSGITPAKLAGRPGAIHVVPAPKLGAMTPPVAPLEPVDLVLDDSGVETDLVSSADSSIAISFVTSTGSTGALEPTPSQLSGPRTSLDSRMPSRRPTTGIGSSPGSSSSLPLAPPPSSAAKSTSQIDPSIMAALDNLLGGSHPLAVVGLDQYQRPGPASSPAGARAGAGAFAANVGTGASLRPGTNPDTAGDLLEFGPMRLFTELALARETGLLRFLVVGHVKDVYLVEGAPESVTGSSRGERFGEYLVERGVLSAADLEAIAPHAFRFGGGTGPTLVGLNLVGADDVGRLRAEHVRLKVADLAATTQGRFEFYRGAITAIEGPELRLDLFAMIGAGVLALPPEHLERRFVSELERRPTTVHPLRVDPDTFELGQVPRELCSRLDGRHTLHDWIGQIRSQEELLSFFRTLHLLLETGLATYM